MIGLGWVFAAVDANRWPVMRAGAKARFDPTAISLEGFFVAQLVVGVLGALIVSGEYGTGTVRQEAGMLAPWTGFAVFCAYLVIGIVLAAVLLKCRDA